MTNEQVAHLPEHLADGVARARPLTAPARPDDREARPIEEEHAHRNAVDVHDWHGLLPLGASGRDTGEQLIECRTREAQRAAELRPAPGRHGAALNPALERLHRGQAEI